MKYFILRIMLLMLVISFGSGCAPVTKATVEQENIPVGGIQEQSQSQGGQLPLETIQQASDTHGGSMVSTAPKTVNSQTPGSQMAAAPSGSSGTTMILGPVNAERVVNNQDLTADAGQSIREAISQVLTASGDIVLFDAPEERFKDDSPRPDLARKGVKFVVKGVASSSTDTGEITVFLRAVETMTGKVGAVASARKSSQNEAATKAAQRLLDKLEGMK